MGAPAPNAKSTAPTGFGQSHDTRVKRWDPDTSALGGENATPIPVHTKHHQHAYVRSPPSEPLYSEVAFFMACEDAGNASFVPTATKPPHDIGATLFTRNNRKNLVSCRMQAHVQTETSNTRLRTGHTLHQ
ncbi:unnamed protein product, partial [Ectocarpus sp. 4 AP-2014]